MRYFLCKLNTIFLGIQSQRTERIISVSRIQSSVFETEKQDIFVSLPLLFGHADVSAPHGIVLKTTSEERKTVLLAPPLDIDIEIPQEDIHSIPKAFGGKLLSFSGACFIRKDQAEHLILFLDIDKILDDFR